MPELTLLVEHPEGLHARPAAQLVKTAQQYQSNITISLGRWSANAKSILEILTLGVNKNSQILVSAEGQDAHEALETIRKLVETDFGDKPARPREAQSQARCLRGLPASAGIAIGPAYLFETHHITLQTDRCEDPSLEQERLSKAMTQARTELTELHSLALQKTGVHEAAIFEAHALILDDPTLLNSAVQMVQTRQLRAEAAFQQAGEELAIRLETISDELIRQRAADIRDVVRGVVRILTGAPEEAMPALASASILFADDLSPSDTIRLDRSLVLGIYVSKGSRTSHAAILARSLGIPAVIGGGLDLQTVKNGIMTILNGDTGEIILDPAPEALAAQQQAQAALSEAETNNLSAAQDEARTLDGLRVEIAANIGGLADARLALDSGAEGVGLLRTEFLFLDRPNMPTEEEQYEIYRDILEMLAPRPVILRTLDIGGDKRLPYFPLPQEENPFLGLRAARLCFQHPELWQAQLRAALRAGHGRKLRIMLPMIASLSEVSRARQVITVIRADLQAEGKPAAQNIEIGVMIEIPSAALMADALAREVDFFSIGTNDLSQYTFAADRMNPNVSEIADPFGPGLLRLIKMTVDGAHAHNKPVGMCGEFAGELLAVPLLVGLGLDELSMNPRQIPAVKALIRRIPAEDCKKLAAEALLLADAADVKELCTRFIQ